MPDRSFDFDAAYDDAIIDDAAKAFVHRLFKKYVWLLVAACFMNIVGFVLVLLLPGSGKVMTLAIGIVAALGPLFFSWEYFRLPRTLAAPMKKGLKPTTRVSVSSSSFTMSAKGRSFTKRWSDLRAILELSDYFLLIIAPLAFTFIPKKDTPQEAQQLIREAAGWIVQPNPALNTDASHARRAG
jgi:YcxB-like protein